MTERRTPTKQGNLYVERHSQMKLYDSTVRQSEQFLAEIRVESDDSTLHNGFDVKRKVSGTIQRTGQIWNEFLRMWGAEEFAVDGVLYNRVPRLMIDYDFYHNWPHFLVEGRSIKLCLFEQLYGRTLDEYLINLRDRNERLESRIRMLHECKTVNDFRRFEGNEPWAIDRPIPPDDLRVMREHELSKLRPNTIT